MGAWLSLLIAFAVSLPLASAQMSPDTPNPEEEFRSFFARITRGGSFPGIYLEPTPATQTAFLNSIKRGFWVGMQNQAMAELERQGVDLWRDWYVRSNAFEVILNSSAKKSAFARALAKHLEDDHGECPASCLSADEILARNWDQLDAFARQEFAKAFLFDTHIFGDRPVIDFLADVYEFPARAVRASTKIKILNNDGFAAAVRALGFGGPIYFRGITAPDPENPTGHIILLNDDLLFSQSPFESNFLKALELVGILAHELSHVFQDLKGRSLGFDIQVRSAEAALLIEGSAEYLAEAAMLKAAARELGPSALSLYVAHQAVEIVYREGNSSAGLLFPYTVGLPFAHALYSQVGPLRHGELTNSILEFLDGQISIADWLKQSMFM